MQWTADRLVSRTNPLELYNVDRERQLGRGLLAFVIYNCFFHHFFQLRRVWFCVLWY